jgi:MOSC domain-containing protein YiiM
LALPTLRRSRVVRVAEDDAGLLTSGAATSAPSIYYPANTSPGGVPKLPTAGAHARDLGLDGDGHVSPKHGGPRQAVCLYSMEAIERIAGEGHQAFPGAYGEEPHPGGHRLAPPAGRGSDAHRLR